MIDVAVDLGLALDVGPDPIILLLLALIADALFGGGAPRVDRARFSPRAVLARMIGGLERRLNREWRGAITRLIRGLLLVVVVAALSYGAGWALLALAAAVPFTWIIALALLFTLVSQRGAFDAARGISRALAGDGLAAARRAALPLLGEEGAALPQARLVDRTVSRLAERLSADVVAPAFWFVLLGLPGLCAYVAIAIMGEQLREDRPEFESFGFPASRLDEVIGYLPAFLTGLFLSLAALVVPGASPLRGLTALAGRRVAGPLNRWWPAAVMHAAFGSDPASSGHPQPPANLLDRVLYLYAVAVGVNFLAVLLVAMRRVAM